MGVLSSLNKERKRATSKAGNLFEDKLSFIKDATKDVFEVTSITGAGRKEVRKMRSARKSAARIQKKMQTEQQRKAILEGAKLDNEIALRSRVAKQGGRRSLLSMGETGSLLS